MTKGNDIAKGDESDDLSSHGKKKVAASKQLKVAKQKKAKKGEEEEREEEGVDKEAENGKAHPTKIKSEDSSAKTKKIVPRKKEETASATDDEKNTDADDIKIKKESEDKARKIALSQMTISRRGGGKVDSKNDRALRRLEGTVETTSLTTRWLENHHENITLEQVKPEFKEEKGKILLTVLRQRQIPKKEPEEGKKKQSRVLIAQKNAKGSNQPERLYAMRMVLPMCMVEYAQLHGNGSYPSQYTKKLRDAKYSIKFKLGVFHNEDQREKILNEMPFIYEEHKSAQEKIIAITNFLLEFMWDNAETIAPNAISQSSDGALNNYMMAHSIPSRDELFRLIEEDASIDEKVSEMAKKDFMSKATIPYTLEKTELPDGTSADIMTLNVKRRVFKFASTYVAKGAAGTTDATDKDEDTKTELTEAEKLDTSGLEFSPVVFIERSGRVIEHDYSKPLIGSGAWLQTSVVWKMHCTGGGNVYGVNLELEKDHIQYIYKTPQGGIQTQKPVYTIGDDIVLVKKEEAPPLLLKNEPENDKDKASDGPATKKVKVSSKEEVPKFQERSAERILAKEKARQALEKKRKASSDDEEASEGEQEAEEKVATKTNGKTHDAKKAKEKQSSKIDTTGNGRAKKALKVSKKEEVPPEDNSSEEDKETASGKGEEKEETEVDAETAQDDTEETDKKDSSRDGEEDGDENKTNEDENDE